MQDRSPSPHGVASQVDSLLREYNALDYFRDRVREAAQKHIEVMEEGEHRAKRRRDAVVKEGVWDVSLDAAVVKEKTKEGYFDYSEVFRGRIELPSGITEPLMYPTYLAEFPNRPMEPQCLCDRIPRGDWSEEDEHEVAEFNEKLKGWEKERLAYVTPPKDGGPSKLEEDWRPIFELAQTRGFPDEGDDGLEYIFMIVAWLPADLHPDRDGPTDPLPVPGTEVSLNSKYAGLAAIYDAHWAGSKRIAPWGVVTCGDKVSPASGLLGESKTPEEPGSYRAASWYYQLVRTAKELDGRNTRIVASWVADVEADLAGGQLQTTVSERGKETLDEQDTNGLIDKGVAPRDECFVRQYEASGTDTYHKPAKVHHKWNTMRLAERVEICPDAPNKVTKSAVEQAIKRFIKKRDRQE